MIGTLLVSLSVSAPCPLPKRVPPTQYDASNPTGEWEVTDLKGNRYVYMLHPAGWFDHTGSTEWDKAAARLWRQQDDNLILDWVDHLGCKSTLRLKWLSRQKVWATGDGPKEWVFRRRR